MQAVGIPGAAEQAEDHVVLIDEGRDVACRDYESEQRGIAKGAKPDDVHGLSGLLEILPKFKGSRVP